MHKCKKSLKFKPSVSPLSWVSCVPASCVCFWFVSCPLWVWLLVHSCPAVFVNCLWLSCEFIVYSLLPDVPVCVSLALPCPALFVYIKDCYFLLQVHLKKWEYHEKSQYFLSLISEMETHMLYTGASQKIWIWWKISFFFLVTYFKKLNFHIF